jgi:hypothetical protein
MEINIFIPRQSGYSVSGTIVEYNNPADQQRSGDAQMLDPALRKYAHYPDPRTSGF